MDKLNGKPSCDFLAPKEFLPILLVVLETFAKGAWKFALTKNHMTVFWVVLVIQDDLIFRISIYHQ